MNILQWAKFKRFNVKAGDIIQHKISKDLYSVSNGIQFHISSKPVTDTFYSITRLNTNPEEMSISMPVTKLNIFQGYDIVKVGSLLYGR